MDCKDRIVKIFYQNVKGRIPDVHEANSCHDGKYGHWLERQFGIVANSSNKSDLWVYELKIKQIRKQRLVIGRQTSMFLQMLDIANYSKATQKLKNKIVLCVFLGNQIKNKNGRYSWSGKACPKVSEYNQFGQILSIEANKDIVVRYSYSKDQRKSKSIIVPKKLQQENIVIVRWYGKYSPSTKKTDKCLKEKLENKFNNREWFT